ncbi:MAG: MBL fold metallo-hydrolase [Prolixibacteraceae bacterium]|jgi:L-ascorbate metabolism protein UlaG (beta-lactamase superfamily)|nr:MBL fold metallo-hydrolase [Prolixibacteraceae bacterium]
MKNLLLLFVLFLYAQVTAKTTNESKVKFHPIQHATLVIEYENTFIFVDPAGDLKKLKEYPSPDLILITHTHGDHLNPEIIGQIKNNSTIILGNKAAIDQLSYGIFLMNGEKKTVNSIMVEAVPMYNISEGRILHHTKGVGNGYIVTLGDEKIYISGDTEDTKEIRALKNIDHAFLCMNLPFTMTPEQAASAVLDFKPKKVYPYHYSQADSFSDIKKFKRLVTESSSTDVILLDWYPDKEMK